MTTSPQLVHEAEAQRQHIRIQLPAEVNIDGTHYTVADWSNGGMALRAQEGRSLPHEIQAGTVFNVVVYFRFEGFNLDVPLRIQITNVSEDRQRFGCSFYELDRNQRSLIQYFVTSYISGELVQVQDVIDVVARNNMTKARNIPSATEGLTSQQLLKRKLDTGIRSAGVALITLLLVGYIALSVYEELYVVKASSAKVAAETLTVDTPAGGKIYYRPLSVDTQVEKGQPLITVATSTGNALSVDSPCNCIVKGRLLENNRIVNKGQPALELVMPDAKTHVEALISHEDAIKIAVGQEALIALPGHDQHLRGTISSIQASPTLTGKSLITIQPAEELPATFVDDPVEIRVDTLNLL